VKAEVMELLEKLKTSQISSPQSVSSKKGIETEGEKIGFLRDRKPYIKDFIKEKKPQGALQTTVVLAYYMNKFEGKETFTKDDLKKYWTVSGQKPPKNIWQSAIDGKNRYGWYEEVSKGEYKISPHGIYFVENELPKETQ